jgi:hypothetical protein
VRQPRNEVIRVARRFRLDDQAKRDPSGRATMFFSANEALGSRDRRKDRLLDEGAGGFRRHLRAGLDMIEFNGSRPLTFV